MEKCDHCGHVEQLWAERQFVASALKFIAVASPLVLAGATFIVLVTRG